MVRPIIPIVPLIPSAASVRGLFPESRIFPILAAARRNITPNTLRPNIMCHTVRWGSENRMARFRKENITAARKANAAPAKGAGIPVLL